MSKHKALTGAIAALASVATLGALAAPALAADTTYSPNGKPVAELAKHGGAQRIATIGNKNAKNVVLFLGDGMGDSEITVARDYLKGANGHFEGLDAVGQPGALGDVQAGRSVHDLLGRQRQQGQRRRQGWRRQAGRQPQSGQAYPRNRFLRLRFLLGHRHQDLQQRR